MKTFVYEGNPKKVNTEDGPMYIPTFWIIAEINNLNYLYQKCFEFYSEAIDKSEELYQSLLDMNDWELFEQDRYEEHSEYVLDGCISF